jgi:hypothetical protein
MQKHAAATALVIAVNITMLTPAVSAGAGNPWSGGAYGATLGNTCRSQCAVELWNTAKLWDRASFIQNKPLRDACIAKCVAAKTAAQH